LSIRLQNIASSTRLLFTARIHRHKAHHRLSLRQRVGYSARAKRAVPARHRLVVKGSCRAPRVPAGNVWVARTTVELVLELQVEAQPVHSLERVVPLAIALDREPTAAALQRVVSVMRHLIASAPRRFPLWRDRALVDRAAEASLGHEAASDATAGLTAGSRRLRLYPFIVV
jgi:hypothetical protein